VERKVVHFLNVKNILTMKRILMGIALSLTVFMLSGQNYIDGTLLYHNNPEYPISEAEVMLYDQAGQLIATTITNADGYFGFEDVPDGSYNVEFSTDLDLGHVTMEDALSIVFYLAGIVDYSPLQQLAMDVNGSGNIGMDDFTYILIQHILFGNPFPVGEWVFEDYEVNTNTRSGDGSIGGSRTGDAEGVLVPTGRDEVQGYELLTRSQIHTSTDEVWIPVFAQLSEQSILGYVLAINFNPEQLEILDVKSPLGEVNYSIVDNQLRISWIDAEAGFSIDDNTPLTHISVKIKDQTFDGKYFTLGSNTQILGQDGKSIDYLVFEMPELIFQNITATVFPNPTTDFVNLKLSMDESTDLMVKIYNPSGQLLVNKIINAVKGIQTKQVILPQLIPGIYQIVVQDVNNGQFLINKKLIIK
jgi:hypothetical protein